MENSNALGLRSREGKDEPGEAPVKKQLSEAELQLKDMVKKQLNKTITLENELAREKRFLTATVYKDEQQKRAGTLSLEQFKHHAKTEQELQDLRDRGLTDQEIELSLLNCDENMSNKKASQNSVELGKSEVATQRAKESLTERLKLRGDALQKETSYSNAREMTRREMEIELSLHRSTDKADKLKHLVKPKITDFSQDDPVMQTLKEYEEREKWMKRTRKSQAKPVETPKRMRCAQGYVNEEDEREEDECEEDDIDVLVGPVLAPLHVRVKPLDEAHVKRNKLSIDEIKSIPKFKNYDPGVPSKVLYIKNLPRNAYKEDLAKLFVRFECLDEPVMQYRLMDGRMKGQAFVTFKDKETAQSALEFANGFIFQDRPLIIAFGKGTIG